MYKNFLSQNNEVLQMILENKITPSLKNCGLETSPMSIYTFWSFTNLLVKYDYIKVSNW